MMLGGVQEMLAYAMELRRCQRQFADRGGGYVDGIQIPNSRKYILMKLK